MADKKRETEDEKELRLAETTDISPKQAKDLMRKYGKDSKKVDEERRTSRPRVSLIRKSGA